MCFRYFTESIIFCGIYDLIVILANREKRSIAINTDPACFFFIHSKLTEYLKSVVRGIDWYLKTGKKIQNNVQNIIHKGIALRPFEKKFNLDPSMEVTEAILSQGMLNIKLFKRDPEIIQPKKIEIKTT